MDISWLMYVLPLSTLSWRTLREKCLYSELFWTVFFGIRTEYGEILRISPYLVRMRANKDQNNSKYGYFLRGWRFLSFRNQSNSMDCFLYDRDPRHERVKTGLIRFHQVNLDEKHKHWVIE